MGANNENNPCKRLHQDQKSKRSNPFLSFAKILGQFQLVFVDDFESFDESASLQRIRNARESILIVFVEYFKQIASVFLQLHTI